MKLQAPLIVSQRDGRWASIILGFNAANSSYTIGLYGCLITALGMYVNMDPAAVNQKLKDNNGFSQNSGDFIWSKCTVLGLNQTYVSTRYTGPVTDQGISKMKELLDGGFPLICEIDFNPATNGEEMHFVLITGYDGDTFYADDPWTGQAINMDSYGGVKRAVIQFRAYDKKLSSGAVQVPVDSQVFENLVRKSTIYDKVVQKLNVADSETVVMAELDKLIGYEDSVVEKDKKIEEANTQIVGLQNQIKELEDKQAQLTTDNTDLQKKASDQEMTILTQTGSIKDISNKLADLKKKCTPSTLTGWRKSVYEFLIR